MYDARCVTIHMTYKYRDFVFGVPGVLCGTLRQLYLKRLLTLLQRFLVGDRDFRYFEDGQHFEDGGVATPHSSLR